MKKLFRFIIIFILLITSYVVFLMVGHAIPQEAIRENAQISYDELSKLGLYYSVVEGASWDNWTDAYIVNTIATEYEGSLLEKALANAYTYTTTEHEDGVIGLIKYALEPDVNTDIVSYSRYWVGNITIYKLLMIFMPISGIRTLLLMITITLFVTAVLNIYNLMGKKGVISFVLSVLIAMYIPNSMCLVFSTDIILMLAMVNICCLMIKKAKKIDSYYILYFICGSICAYTNYWAFPLITLGFPLILITIIKLKNSRDTKEVIKENILMSICWTVGLCSTVLMKQVLCYFVLGDETGTERLLMRMGNEMSIIERIVSTVQGIINELSDVKVMFLIIIISIWMGILVRNRNLKKKYNIIPLLIIASYPVAWWFLLAGHCGSHGFARYMYGVAYYAVLNILFMNCEKLLPTVNVKWKSYKKIISRDILVTIMFVFGACILMRYTFHYNSVYEEPWSLSTIDNVYLDEDTQVVQTIDFRMGDVYLENAKTILVNVPEEMKSGLLHVEFLENERVKKIVDIPIRDIVIGDWFSIPIDCMMYSDNLYALSYSVKVDTELVPYLLLQDISQSVPGNEELFVNGVLSSGTIATQYEYDLQVISGKMKLSIIFIVYFALMVFLTYIDNKGVIRFNRVEIKE